MATKTKKTTKKSSTTKEAITSEQSYLADKRERALMLRTCSKDFTSHNNFKWPESGYVECPDFNNKPECGGGLHGLLYGNGDYSLLSDAPDAVWQVVEIILDEHVSTGQKIKVPRGFVTYSGNMAQAMAMIADEWIKHVVKISDRSDERVNASSGNYSQNASSGDESRNASSGNYSRNASSGNYSQNASSGNYSQNASSGNYSRNASSGNYSQNASSGDGSRNASSGYYSRNASSGNYSRNEARGAKSIAVAAGLNSTGLVGEDGCLALAWWDEKAERYRLAVGYEGENIKRDVLYGVDNSGNFVEVK